ncbi:MAG TPA: hypothetical protein VMO81_07420 [Aestuariivirgaceae bacterium]|nr:hypothetical protein [Aestuariivirgaceae bacterium]
MRGNEGDGAEPYRHRQGAHCGAYRIEQHVEPVKPDPAHHQHAAQGHLECKKPDDRNGMGRDQQRRAQKHDHGGDEQDDEIGRHQPSLDAPGIDELFRRRASSLAHVHPSATPKTREGAT